VKRRQFIKDSARGVGATALAGVAIQGVDLAAQRVTLEAIDKGSGVPLAGVELRLGRFRAATNEAGIAHVEVPGGGGTRTGAAVLDVNCFVVLFRPAGSGFS